MTLYHPDYNLEWLVRSDASELGVGGVLYQIKDGILQPISFTSWKFTKPARSWSTTDQEAYAIFHTVMKFSYFLRGKRFTVETDHYNLIFMRNSIVNRVQRQCAYLQSFDMFLRHIAGIKNVTSDMISRAFPAMSHILQTISWVTAISPSEKSMLDQVHGSRIGHHGEARTMMYLKKFFPEAKISQQTVREFLDACWVCQKTRYKASPSIPPVMKSITYPEHRSAVVIDGVTLPKDIYNNTTVYIIMNPKTKLHHLFAAPSKEAEQAAIALFLYYVYYGGFSHVHSDPGSDFTSKVFQKLTKFLGSTRSITMVDNPQADGTEGQVKKFRHDIVNLCMEESCILQWSAPHILSVVQLIGNENISSETGISPFDATFGTDLSLDRSHSIDPLSPNECKSDESYITLLNANLVRLRQVYSDHQKKIQDKRNTPLDAPRGQYQPGDYVLLIVKNKYDTGPLSPRHQGPFQVVSHKENSNTVSVQDLISETFRDLNATHLMYFHGDDTTAYEAAKTDQHRH